MQHLLLLLPVRDENWFHCLIRAMQLSGYQRIVDVVYPVGMTTLTVSCLKLTLHVMNVASRRLRLS